MKQPNPISIRPDPETAQKLDQLCAAQPDRSKHDVYREALKRGAEAVEAAKAGKDG